MKYCIDNKGLIVYFYVIMTNHLHLMIRSETNRLSDTVRDFKRFTAFCILKSIEKSNVESRREWMDIVFKYHAKYNKRVKEKQFWTHENHVIELTTNEMIDSNYVHENPVRADWVENPEDYLYGSARNYTSIKDLIVIEMI